MRLKLNGNMIRHDTRTNQPAKAAPEQTNAPTHYGTIGAAAHKVDTEGRAFSFPRTAVEEAAQALDGWCGVTVNDLNQRCEKKPPRQGSELSAAVVDAVAMATMRFIQRRKSVTAANPTTRRA